MAVALALLAAVAFAAGTVLQQRGTLQTSSSGDDARFLVQILHEPVWLAGGLLQALGWMLQAAALDRGPLVVVQALTALSLVIALPLGVRWTAQHVERRDVVAACVVVVGVIGFLMFGAPEGGTTEPSAAQWWAAGVLALVLVGTVAVIAVRKHGPVRAALFGGAAGVGFALQAAVTKVFVTEIGNGVAALLTTWSTYVLIASALAGFALQQSALKTGALAAAMSSSNASTLLFGTLFGFLVFDERLTHGNGRVALAIAGLALAIAGVVRLAASESGAPEDRSEVAASLPR